MVGHRAFARPMGGDLIRRRGVFVRGVYCRRQSVRSAAWCHAVGDDHRFLLYL